MQTEHLLWPAYWSDAEWKVLAGLFGIVGAIAAPFFKSRFSGRSKVSKATEAEHAMEREDRQAREKYATIERERDRAVARQYEIEAERETLEENRDEGWDLARAWEDWAHDARHAHVSTVMAHNVLLDFFRRFQLGTLADEQAKIIAEKTPDQKEPPRVPRLRDLKRKPSPS